MKYEIRKNDLNQYIVVRIEGGTSLYDYPLYSYLYRKLEIGPWAFDGRDSYTLFFESLREAEYALKQYKMQNVWQTVKTYEDL